MVTRRRKIARSAVRRVKRRESKNAKLRSLRSRKHSSKRMRTHQKGGGDVWRTFLVYYGPSIIRTNPKLRLLSPFVGVLLYSKGKWSLCISNYLGRSDIITDAWDELLRLDEESDSSGMMEHSRLINNNVLLYRRNKPIYDKASEIFINSFDKDDKDDKDDKIAVKKEIVCNIITHLCGELTDEQKGQISTFIDKEPEHAIMLREDTGLSIEQLPIDWFITFEINKEFGELSCCDIDGNKTKIIDKVPIGKSKPFHIVESKSDSASIPPAPLAEQGEKDEFLVVEYDKKEKGFTDVRLFPFLLKTTKNTFFGNTNPIKVESDYKQILANNTRNSRLVSGLDKTDVNTFKNYLKEITEPGIDSTHIEPLT